ncbi:MAG: hypothetical protein ACK4RZ_14645, partial [Paracoccaceae bacterium]
LFRDGLYPTSTIPVGAVDRNGRVDFSRPIRRVTETEALALLRPASGPLVPAIVVAPTSAIAPATPSGWLARLATFFSNFTRRV